MKLLLGGNGEGNFRFMQTSSATQPRWPLSAREREEFILGYAPLVRRIAHRIAVRLPPHLDLEDLVNSGFLGLMDALQKFDPDRNIAFRTYAEFRIRGAILDELRSRDWLPRSVREKANRLERVNQEVEGRLGRPATEEELAAGMGLDLESLQQLLQRAGPISFLRLDDCPGLSELSEDSLADLLLDPSGKDPLAQLELGELKQFLAQEIERMSEREKQVLGLYYLEELTLKEIGEVMSVTESRVCQLHSQALIRLRGRIKKRVWQTSALARESRPGKSGERGSALT